MGTGKVYVRTGTSVQAHDNVVSTVLVSVQSADHGSASFSGMFPSINAVLTLHPGTEFINTMSTSLALSVRGSRYALPRLSVAFQGILEKPLKVKALMVSYGGVVL